MTEVIVREGKREDCIEIRRLIQELADFEKMPDGPKISAEILEKEGFETQPPLFKCIVAENASDKRLVGYALFYMAFSTWRGRRLWLEDIMVSESHRGHGVGSKLFRQVCQQAISLGCETLNFSVLNWNPATKFYGKFDAEDITISEKWHSYVLSKEKMLKLI